MPALKESPRTARMMGALLAIVWLCAGVAALVVGATAQRWLLVLGGLVALWYGVIWVYVARWGRRLTLREALTPWRVKEQRDADAQLGGRTGTRRRTRQNLHSGTDPD